MKSEIIKRFECDNCSFEFLFKDLIRETEDNVTLFHCPKCNDYAFRIREYEGEK